MPLSRLLFPICSASAAGATRSSPVQHDTLPRRNRSRPHVVAEPDRVLSRGQGDRLVDLFRRKLRARSVEHRIVIRAGSFHRQGSRLILAAAASTHLHRHGDVVELGGVTVTFSTPIPVFTTNLTQAETFGGSSAQRSCGPTQEKRGNEARMLLRLRARRTGYASARRRYYLHHPLPPT